MCKIYRIKAHEKIQAFRYSNGDLQEKLVAVKSHLCQARQVNEISINVLLSGILK